MTAIVLAIVLLLAALAAVPIGRALTGDYFSPPALVIAAWCGTLGLFALRLLPYPPLAQDTIWLIAGTIALLAGGAALGMFAGARLSSARARGASSPASTSTVRFAPRWVWWTMGYAVIGLVGTAWYVALVVRMLGWDGFRNGELLRAVLNSQQIPSTFLFLQFFALAAALLAFALWLGGHLRARHLWLPAVCSLGTLITTDRTQTFTLLVAACFMTAFRLGPRLRPRPFGIAAVLVGLALVGNFVLVGVWRGTSWNEFQHLVEQAHASQGTAIADAQAVDHGSVPTPRASLWPGAARPLAMPYFYATASYPALDVLLHMDRPRTGGGLTGYPVARALERLGLLASPLPPYIPKFVPVTPVRTGAAPLQTNAPTFLYYPLEDFGPRGALLYALAVGLACGLAWSWARHDRSSGARLLMVGQMSTALLLTIFVNKFNNTASWYVLMLTLLPFVLRAGAERAPGSRLQAPARTQNPKPRA